MDMDFEEFEKIVKQGIEKGEIELLGGITELSELDLAMQFAIEMEMHKEKVHIFSVSEIPTLILKWCGKEVYNRVFQEVKETPND